MHYLGVDFGLRKIGLAVSDGEIASPWKIIEAKSLDSAVEQLYSLIVQEGFGEVVVGIPESGKIVGVIKRVINKLKKRGVKIEQVDETLSSKLGQRKMIELNLSKKKRRYNDAFAAAEILQSFLDQKIKDEM
ncbi:pre-16S rRNA-processing nuclease YqgF [Candidatus Daviesbacteria bacterium]|nr:pre-16S rRNA-processing nuclease YqgF [Candidatus Daviesbacteria bacterium]